MSLKISQLTAAAALAGTEQIPGVQSAANVSITPSQLATYVQSQLPVVVNTLNNFTATTTPTVDDDAGDGYSVGSRWLNTTTGQVFTCQNSTAGAAVWVAQGVAEHPGYVAGRYYVAEVATRATSAGSAAQLIAYPVVIRRRVTIDELSIRLGTTAGAAGTLARLGLYRDAGGYPGALVAQGSSELPLDTSGVVVATALSPSITVNPGVYWLAYMATGTPTLVQATGGGNAFAHALGGATAEAALNSGVTGVAIAYTYASGFPSTFTAGAGLRTAPVPMIAFRVA